MQSLQKQIIGAMKENNYQQVVEKIKTNKFAHCTTVMVTEERMKDLKRRFIFAKVPYGGEGKCFMFCLG